MFVPVLESGYFVEKIKGSIKNDLLKLETQLNENLYLYDSEKIIEVLENRLLKLLHEKLWQ